MSADVARVRDRRQREQAALVDAARTFAGALSPSLAVRAVVVFGSVARGDFNVWSDVDVLVVADHLPERWLDRMEAIGDAPVPVQPLAWTPPEWRRQLARRNPVAVEAVAHGVWLAGSPSGLAGQDG